MPSLIQRLHVLSLYRQLIHLGRSYPKDPEQFTKRIHDVFLCNRHLQNEMAIEVAIAKGEYVVKELEALYRLKKYRAMKNRYENM